MTPKERLLARIRELDTRIAEDELEREELYLELDKENEKENSL